jgi:hypothetical protein
MLDMCSPQDLSVAHDFLVQTTQENHLHKKKKFIKIVIKDSRYFFINRKRCWIWKVIETQNYTFLHKTFFSSVHEMRRLQDLSITHNFLAQEGFIQVGI